MTTPPAQKAAARLISFRSRRKSGAARIHRLSNMAAAVALILLRLPLITIVALAIKLGSPGPVFTAQSRIGPHGRVFPVLSFRTTFREARLRQSWKPSGRETRVGSSLRYTRIADLPRLINVVRGEMRLFGTGQERSVFAE